MQHARFVLMPLFFLSLFASSSAQASEQAQTGAAQGVLPNLDLAALSEPLQDLTPADRKLVADTIHLIEQKQHAQALVKLIGLTASNPKNSALRVIRAYVLLELGNVAGALGDARLAEKGNGLRSAYRCWFLAQVAYLAGDKPLCRREVKHLAGDPSYRKKAEILRDTLQTRSK